MHNNDQRIDPVLHALIQRKNVFVIAQIATASLSYEPAIPLDMIEELMDINSAAYKPASVLFVASFVKLKIAIH